jgi:CRP-like cAMP-binding protein
VSDAFFGYDAGPAAPPSPAAARTLLADLSSDEWERFIAFAARRRYAPGTTVVEAGGREPALFIVAAGRVVVQGPDGTAQRGEGEMFGVLSFLDGAPSDVSAVVAANAPAELLMLSPDALQRLAAWKPRVALALLRDLGGHVAARLRRLQPGD